MRPETIEAVRSLVNAFGFRQTEHVIAQYRDELASPDARWLLEQQLPRHEAGSRVHRVIATRLRALEQCIELGSEAVFDGYDSAAETIGAIVNAPDWDEIRSSIEGNRHRVLAHVADIALADLVMQPLEPQDESQVLATWNLIEQCRQLGVEAAIEEHKHPRRGVILGARRNERQAQIAAWPGREEYVATMATLTEPNDRPKHVEVARAELARIDREALPIVWAHVAMDLADALRKQGTYSDLAPMAEVIALYHDAIARLTPDGEPEEYAHAHRCLGDAHLRDSDGDQAANAAAAIPHFEVALGMLRPRVESTEWATVASHLAEALLRRAHGDPTIDVDRAVSLLEQVVELLDNTGEHALRAGARMTLAVALGARVSDSRATNLRAAAGHVRDAIDDVDAGEHPDIWAMANAHLGSLYMIRTGLEIADGPQLRRQAERYFRAALSRADAGARALARAHAGLGWVLSDMHDGGPEVVVEAIAHYEAAIELYSAMGSAVDGERGSVIRNLAITYSESIGTLPDAMVHAERHFRAALDLFSPDEYPTERRDTLRPMATMYFDASRWADALACFEEAIGLSDVVFAGRYTELGKAAEAAGTRTLYGPAAYALLRLGRPAEALLTIERGKVRMLAEALAWKDSGGVRHETASEDTGRLSWARSEILRLEAESRSAGIERDAERSARLGRQLRDAYRYLASLQTGAGGEEPGDMDLAAILAEIPARGALVAPLVTTHGGVAIVVPAGSDDVSSDNVVDLPEFSFSAVAALLSGDGRGGWLNAYLAWLRDAGTFNALLASLHELAVSLWAALLRPVSERLESLGVADGSPVVLMPSGLLGLLPLHAAHRPVAGQWRAFAEDFVVSYSPSVRALQVCRRRLMTEERQGQQFVAVANPTRDLRFADIEATRIADLFESDPETGDAASVIAGLAATRSAVMNGMRGRQYLHFACHAEFHWTDPNASGLRLAAGDWLRIADVLSPAVDLRSSRLVTLSACETGLAEFRTMPDEFVGLPGAFLEAGAPAVISSLWPVDDVSTSLLMKELYRAHRTGADAANALQRAQTWLRTSTAAQLGLVDVDRQVAVSAASAEATYYDENPDVVPFAHPYYWAGFVVTGAGEA